MKTASVPVSRAISIPPLGSIDWVLTGTVGGLVGFGLLMLLSASSLMADATYGNALHFPSRQLAGVALGALLGGIVLVLPWPTLRRLSWPAYLVCLLGLVLVLTPLGNEANGASRWIGIGGVHVQPSEFAKVAVVMILANYLDANAGRLGDFVGVVFPAIGLVVPVILLLLFEPDFGSAVITAGAAGVCLFLAGLRWRWLGMLGSLAALATSALVLVEPYRLRRLVSFLDPYADPEGAGYQVVQAWIALASGGMSGEGLAAGVSQRGFLPEAHTDFIAAVVAEELGAIGWCVLVVAYAVLIFRGTTVAAKSKDVFGTVMAGGLTGLLAMNVLINLGVVVGWLPAKGLVLPFMSYGVSAVAAHLLCIALLVRTAVEARSPTPPATGAS